jgi:hypothetical protein
MSSGIKAHQRQAARQRCLQWLLFALLCVLAPGVEVVTQGSQSRGAEGPPTEVLVLGPTTMALILGFAFGALLGLILTARSVGPAATSNPPPPQTPQQGGVSPHSQDSDDEVLELLDDGACSFCPLSLSCVRVQTTLRTLMSRSRWMSRRRSAAPRRTLRTPC